MLCEAVVSCVACAPVSLLAWRNGATRPSNTRSEAQAICGLLFCRATLATSSGALSVTLTAVATGKLSTVATNPLSCVSAVAVTVTVKLQLFCNPAPSVAVQVTPVLPMGKVEPELGVQLVTTVPQL